MQLNIRLIPLQALMALLQIALQWNLVETAGASDGDSECNKRIVSCITCSTEGQDQGANLCRDPFDPRVKKEFKRMHDSNPMEKVGFSKYNISTVMCEGFCIKWIKVPLFGDGSQIVRTCSNTLDIRFSQNTPVCISESRTGKGTMCFCKENMCNPATTISSICRLFLFEIAVLAATLRSSCY